MKECLRGISLAITAFCLGYSSGLFGLGIIASAAFVIVVALNKTIRHDVRKRPVYHKWLAYAGIVPCAIWWVLTPAVEYGMSPYLVYIPAWYLLYLAFLQLRSIGRGGFEVFVVFDGVVALIAATYHAPRGIVVAVLVALLLWVFSFVRRGVPFYKFILFALLFAMFAGSSVVGFRYWKGHHHAFSSKYAGNFYLKHHMMGFDPAVALGSFNSNYVSRYNNEVVIRVWDTLAPRYIKAAVYDKYMGGVWKLPTSNIEKLYPSRYQVDYAVFEIADSITSEAFGTRRVWVQSSLDNFGFVFAAPNAVGVALKNADSLSYYSSGIFSSANVKSDDWFYFVPNEGTNNFAAPFYSEDLLVSKKDTGLVDSVLAEMNVDSLVSQDSLLHVVASYFALNYKYSLVIPGLSGKKDPLRMFFRHKQGYCEYFATMAALVLRRRGVPARFVTGFVQGERVPGRPYVAFRRFNTHAWVEVYLHGRWVMFDPTPPSFYTGDFRNTWFSKKMESLKGRFARVIHFLKDGEWRRSLDTWQSVMEKCIHSPILYVVVLLMMLALLFARFFKGLRLSQNKKQVSNAVRVAYWSKILTRTERGLFHFGFVRNDGETVAMFAKRIREALAKETKVKRRLKLEKALLQLEDYERNRWCILDSTSNENFSSTC